MSHTHSPESKPKRLGSQAPGQGQEAQRHRPGLQLPSLLSLLRRPHSTAAGKAQPRLGLPGPAQGHPALPCTDPTPSNLPHDPYTKFILLNLHSAQTAPWPVTPSSLISQHDCLTVGPRACPASQLEPQHRLQPLIQPCWTCIQASLKSSLPSPHQNSSKFSRSVVYNSATPLDCSPPDFSVHGILQARKPECTAISYSRVSF